MRSSFPRLRAEPPPPKWLRRPGALRRAGAKAGIQVFRTFLDPRFRGGDRTLEFCERLISVRDFTLYENHVLRMIPKSLSPWPLKPDFSS